MIPESFVQDLLARIDIVDVIGKYVQLKKGGVNLLGLCPFHQEKSPSFTVSPSKQFYHCFGCGAHGTAIRFLMEYSGMPFPDAVKALASSVGMQVPEQEYSPRKAAQIKQIKTRQELLYGLLEQARDFYYSQLKQHEAAINYFKNRSINGKTAKLFNLGWSGSSWQNLRAIFKNYDDNLLLDSGLVIENEDGRRYDRFRERIMFPIHNSRGRVMGFGGRIIGQGEPKYLNSPETEVFHKGSELYGLWENRSGIHKAGCVLVVEGYMDVVSLARVGVDYAVATLGTATTEEHIKKLIRKSDRIVFSFDGDAAGRKAAWRALLVCLPLLCDDVAIRFMFLPAEHDPDSFVRVNGSIAFQTQVDQAQALSTYLLDDLRRRHRLQEAEGRAACLKEGFALVAQIPASAIRTQIEHELAGLVKLTNNELNLAFERFAKQQKSMFQDVHQDISKFTTSVSSAALTPPDSFSYTSAGISAESSEFSRATDYGVRGGNKRANLSTTEPSLYTSFPNRQKKNEKSGYLSCFVSSNINITTEKNSRYVTPLSKRLLLLLVKHPSMLERINERQLETLNKHPNMSLVVEFITLALSTQARSLQAWQELAQPGSEIAYVLGDLLAESMKQEFQLDPALEWADALRKIEIDNLEQEQQSIIQSGSGDDEQRRRFQAIKARIEHLKK